MLNIQKNYLDYLKSIRNLILETKISCENIDILEKLILNTELVIPVVGSFSAGKSSLINSFLGMNYLPIAITPETSLATELRYSNNEYIDAIKKDNSIDKNDINDIQNIKIKSSEYKFLKVYINNEKLREIEPLVLVDMPGFDSPLDLHNKAIINYLSRGVYYIVLISVEEGNITRTMIRQLSDIKMLGRDFTIFLSKSDLRAENEVLEIKNKIEEQINDYLDEKKNIISISNRDGSVLEKVLKEINPEKIFESLYKEEIKNIYFSFIEDVNISISTLKKDEDEIKTAILELNKSIEKIKQKREKMLQDIQNKYSNTNINKLVENVGLELVNSADELTQIALKSGQEGFSQVITEIIRSSLIENLKILFTDISHSIVDDFTYEIKDINKIMSSFNMENNWIENINNNIKIMFDKMNGSLNSIIKTDGSDLNKITKMLLTLLAIITDTIVPILELIIVFLPDILSNYFRNKQQDTIKNNLLTNIIPSIKREIRNKVTIIINEKIKELINEISYEFEKQLQEKQSKISLIEKEKKEKINIIEKDIAKYEKIKEEINNLFKNLTFTMEV